MEWQVLLTAGCSAVGGMEWQVLLTAGCNAVGGMEWQVLLFDTVPVFIP
jgi:hypothetical protein